MWPVGRILNKRNLIAFVITKDIFAMEYIIFVGHPEYIRNDSKAV